MGCAGIGYAGAGYAGVGTNVVPEWQSQRA